MRRACVALALGTIAVGLMVHGRGEALGPVARDVVGDALWAAMIFWWVSAAAPHDCSNLTSSTANDRIIGCVGGAERRGGVVIDRPRPLWV